MGHGRAGRALLLAQPSRVLLPAVTRSAELESHTAERNGREGEGIAFSPPPSRALTGAVPALRAARRLTYPTAHQPRCSGQPRSEEDRSGCPRAPSPPPVAVEEAGLVLEEPSVHGRAHAVRRTPCLCSAGEVGWRQVTFSRGTTMLGRSWSMRRSVQRLLGFLRLRSHLRVNEKQPVVSGRQGGGR